MTTLKKLTRIINKEGWVVEQVGQAYHSQIGKYRWFAFLRANNSFTRVSGSGISAYKAISSAWNKRKLQLKGRKFKEDEDEDKPKSKGRKKKLKRSRL